MRFDFLSETAAVFSRWVRKLVRRPTNLTFSTSAADMVPSLYASVPGGRRHPRLPADHRDQLVPHLLQRGGDRPDRPHLGAAERAGHGGRCRIRLS